ncbi:MAG: hypothetical protein KGQ59_00825 [Bdellovibrionales bacterium]|nr:hypothetical protein [Bdellovibrionales bacterium]
MKNANRWVVVGLVLLLTACQRSNAFRQDQDYYRDNSMYSQKNAPGSATKRFEAMGQPRKKIVILDFWNDTPVKAATVGTFAADELRRSLFVTQRLIVPTDVRTDFSTKDFVQVDQAGEGVKIAQLIREGRRMGVAVIGIGRIGKIVFRQRGDDVGLLRQTQSLAAADVEIKLFDVSAGREILSIGKSGQSSSNNLVSVEGENQQSSEYRLELTKLALRDAVAQLVPDVIKTVEKLSWQGRIAKIVGGKFYINAGKGSGLIHGDILKVLTAGEEVYDPSTGAYLGRAPGQLKGTVEVTDFLGTDGAVAELHTGGNFQEGDTVQLY